MPGQRASRLTAENALNMAVTPVSPICRERERERESARRERGVSWAARTERILKKRAPRLARHHTYLVGLEVEVFQTLEAAFEDAAGDGQGAGVPEQVLPQVEALEERQGPADERGLEELDRLGREVVGAQVERSDLWRGALEGGGAV